MIKNKSVVKKSLKSSAVENLVIDMLNAGIPEPQIEVAFAFPRKWRFDLAWLSLKVAVEVDGGVWIGGRHSYGRGYERDCIKVNEAILLGWKVFRFTVEMATDGRALKTMEEFWSNFFKKTDTTKTDTTKTNTTKTDTTKTNDAVERGFIEFGDYVDLDEPRELDEQ